MQNKSVIIVKGEEIYPTKFPFRPSENYPELMCGGRGGGGRWASEQRNHVYEMIREGFRLSGYDKDRFGLPDWNPLGKFIKSGDTVLLKPNLVMNENHIKQNGTDCLYTHPSVVAAVIDYVIIALQNAGRIIVGDAPMQECDFDALIEKSGYKSMIVYYKELLKDREISVEIVDFRELKSKVIKGVRHSVEGDIWGKVVDLKQESEFTGETNWFYQNMRITNYDPALLKQHHSSEKNEYYVNDYVLSADVMINMPKPKTHRKAGVTISLKNMVGINCRKEYLPHHTNGSKKEGGDEYLNPSALKRIYDRVLDMRNYLAQTRKAYKSAWVLNKCNKAVSAMIRLTQKDDYREGSWYGNDTISRTIVDLNKILFYADKIGNIRKERQRKYLIIADMLISGEKEGPVAPSPKKVGIIAMGEDPVCFDEAILQLMGAKPEYIHTIVHARSPKGTLKLTDSDSIPYLISNDERWNQKTLEELGDDDLLYFVPAGGWKEAFKNLN